jgi:hypothetical protein
MRVALLFTVVIPLSVAAQTPTLKPGRYEVVSEISLAGRGEKLPPRKDLHCYTSQELADLPKIIAGRASSPNCKVLSSKIVESTLTYTTECATGGEGRVISSGEVQFTSSESYHAVVTMKQSAGRAANPMLGGSTLTITAKRVGDCEK